MSAPQRKSIALTNLVINLENPRFEMAPGQREAIQIMIDDQGDKLISLAKDILEFGLNPSELILVITNPDNAKNYVVLEGNRRVTTLKILSNPDLIDKRHGSFAKKVKKFSEQFKKTPIKNVDCVVFGSVDEANKWIRLKHTGENEGIGTVRWDAQQVARFDERLKGKTPIALQAIEFMRKSDHVNAALKDDLSKLGISNIERLLGDPDVRDLLGLKYENKFLQTTLEEKEVAKGLVKIARDFLYNNKTVYDIDKKKNRKEYLESFGKGDIPNKTKTVATDWQLVSNVRPASNASTQLPKKQQVKSLPLSHERKTLIPRDCNLAIKDKRVNVIYRELKNIEVEEFVNCTAIVLRVFVELSVDALIHEKNGKAFSGIKKMTPLKEKVERVIRYFIDTNSIAEDQLKGIKTAVNTTNDLLSIDTFNAYVHNRHYSPVDKNLKIAWDNIQPFMEKIWEIIK